MSRRTSHVIAATALVTLLAAGCASDPSTIEGPIPTAAGTTTAGPPAAGPPSQTPSATPSEQASSFLEIDVEVGGDGKPVGGVKTVDVATGETFTLVVTSAVADEVHLHGYDVRANVEAGGAATISQQATIPGEVEAELESSGTTLVRIRTQ